MPERDQALREKYAYIKKRWLGRGAAHCVHARVISGGRRPNTPQRKIPIILLLLLYRRLLTHEIFVKKIPNFYDTAIASIAVRTRDIAKKIPITLYHQLIPGEHDMTFLKRSLYFVMLSSIAGAHGVLTSNNSQLSAKFLQPHNKAFETLP